VNPELFRSLEQAQSLDRSGKHDEALEAYRLFLELQPGSVEGWAAYGGLLMARGRLEEAQKAYHLDRLLTQMELAGVFRAAAGVVTGEFIGCDEPAASKLASPTANEVLRERLGRLSIPVALGAPIGHGRRNHALPYGTRVELDADAGTLAALEGAVS